MCTVFVIYVLLAGHTKKTILIINVFRYLAVASKRCEKKNKNHANKAVTQVVFQIIGFSVSARTFQAHVLGNWALPWQYFGNKIAITGYL